VRRGSAEETQVLELGKAGTAGMQKGECPVLRDGQVVGAMSPKRWRTAALAKLGAEEWVYARYKRDYVGRWATDPEGSMRLRFWQTSMWKDRWAVDLEGRPAEVGRTTRHYGRGTYGVLIDGWLVAVLGGTKGWLTRPTVDATDRLPLHQQMFLLWMQHVLQRRMAARAGAVAA
jgi:hypothetical protein